MKNLLAIILSITILPSLLFAEQAPNPTNTLKNAVDQVIEIVNEQEFETNGKRRDAIFDVVDQVFDFREMAKRSLGANWKKCSEDEQNEFVDVFSEFLAKTYIDRIDQVKSGMVDFNNEKTKGNRALVETKVNVDEQVFPIDYKLFHNGESWMVYDVVIENVGLISNYRNEFNGIIKKEKFSGLIAKLKEKNTKEAS